MVKLAWVDVVQWVLGQIPTNEKTQQDNSMSNILYKDLHQIFIFTFLHLCSSNCYSQNLQ